jgi:hypothetical protein
MFRPISSTSGALEIAALSSVSSNQSIYQSCTRFLQACSALCKCANWLCQTCTPHHTVAGRSSVSLTHSPFAFPSNCRCGPPFTSYMPGRSIPCTSGIYPHLCTHVLSCILWWWVVPSVVSCATVMNVFIIRRYTVISRYRSFLITAMRTSDLKKKTLLT